MEKANRKRGHALLELITLAVLGMTFGYILMVSYYVLVGKGVAAILAGTFAWVLFYAVNIRKFNQIADEIFSKY